MDWSSIIGTGIGALAQAAVGFAKSAFGVDVKADDVIKAANGYIAANTSAQAEADKADDATATEGLE